MKLLLASVLASLLQLTFAKYACSRVYGTNGAVAATLQYGAPVSGAFLAGTGYISQQFGHTISGAVCSDRYKVVQILGTEVGDFSNDYGVPASSYGNGANAPIDRLFIRCAGLSDPLDKKTLNFEGLKQVHSKDYNSGSGNVLGQFSGPDPQNFGFSVGGYSSGYLYQDSFARFVGFGNANTGTLPPPTQMSQGSYQFVSPSDSTNCVIVGMYSLDSKLTNPSYGVPIGGVGFIFECNDDAQYTNLFNGHRLEDNTCNDLVDDIKNNRKRLYSAGNIPDDGKPKQYYDGNSNDQLKSD